MVTTRRSAALAEQKSKTANAVDPSASKKSVRSSKRNSVNSKKPVTRAKKAKPVEKPSDDEASDSDANKEEENSVAQKSFASNEEQNEQVDSDEEEDADAQVTTNEREDAEDSSDEPQEEKDDKSESEGEAEENPASDEEELNAAEDQEEGTMDAVGFGDAMSKILGQNVNTDAPPILAKRTTARMREIQSERKEAKTAKMSAAEKRQQERKEMVIPDHTTLAQDRKLRSIATKGVVALFNAIEKHQHHRGKSTQKKEEAVKEMSKESFLGLLKGQKSAEKEPSKDKSSWSVLQDDFMMDAKMKDWDGPTVSKKRKSNKAAADVDEEESWRQIEDMDSDEEPAKRAKKSVQ